MSRLDQVISTTVDRQIAPFVVAMVAGHDGVRWQGSAGRSSAAVDAGPDTVFSIFSMTKAIGSLMALMAIDRGLVTMETPVGDVLPAFDRLQVLEAMGTDGPLLRRPRTRGTLRHLLTHRVGMGNEPFYPLMAEYAARTDHETDLLGTRASLNYPLLFDPGHGFAYGVGTDWVGALVSEVDGRPIDRIVREDILEPLGMTSTYFERAQAGDRLAELVLKREDGSFEPAQVYPASHPEIYHMAHALYATAPDYLKFLRLVLNRGELDGRRLLSAEGVERLYTDQSGGATLPVPVLKSSAGIVHDVEPCPGTRKTHTAAFVRNEDGLPGMRGSGSLSWAGLLNTHYWIDPTRDVAAVFMTQMLPFFDPGFMSCFDEFERAVSAEFADGT